MRTTITLDDDVAAGVDRLRRERDVGLSEAVNQLVRSGLLAKPSRRRRAVASRRLGLRIDVSNVAEALDQLDGPGR